MIKFIAYGDIFSISGISCYAHGCNCAGAMGKGIALQFKKRFPQMYLQYRKNVCKINSIQEMFLNLYKELNVYTI